MSKPARKIWDYTPPLPIKLAPFWDNPPKLGEVLYYMIKAWKPVSERVLFMLVAITIVFNFLPDPAEAKTFAFGWMFEVWLRNLVLVTITAGGLHLWLHIWKAQGEDTQYETRPFAKDNGRFTFRNQVHDNMFWTLGPAVLIWSAYECLIHWSWANGYGLQISFAENPVWFLVLLFIIPFWAGAYFYMHHRVLHIGPLYRHVHSWHHRNINTGPWSGLAMHPLEQLILFSDAILFLFLPAHPLHLIFLMMFHGMGAPTSHAGFDKLRLGPIPDLQLGDFFHQLHHKYFDCNYGTLDTPWDKWFGSFHDGTEEGNQMINERRRMLAAKAKG